MCFYSMSLAGVEAEESARMVKLPRELAADHAVLLAEHDIDAVFAAVEIRRS